MYTKCKVSPPAQPMLPRDIPDCPWQEIAADYLTHKGKEYMLVCDLFSKCPFLYMVSTESSQSLSMHLLELISQYRPPCMLHTDNGPPSLHRPYFLIPHFPRSKGFIKCQVCTIKTALSTIQESHKSLGDLLLDLWFWLPSGPTCSHPRWSHTTGPSNTPVSHQYQWTWNVSTTTWYPNANHRSRHSTEHMTSES